jgi:hypothetical protein
MALGIDEALIARQDARGGRAHEARQHVLGAQRREVGERHVDDVGEVSPGGFLRIQALGRILRPDVALELDLEERVALAEQLDMIGREVPPHGMDDDELALGARPILHALAAHVGRECGKIGVNFVGCGALRRRGSRQADKCRQ